MELVAIVDRVSDLASRGGDWYRVVSALPTEAQYLWTTHYLECEVLNGGFAQLFFNTWGQFVEVGLAGYEAMGAKSHARVTARAIRVYDLMYPGHQRFGANGVRPSQAPPRRIFELVDRDFGLIDPTNADAIRVAYATEHSAVLSAV